MASDGIKQLCDEALAKLAKALDEGKSEALTTYLAAVARFHNYSSGNILLIQSQMPTASNVAGFHTWRTKFNRFVKKGEKGIMILAPMIGKKEDKETGEEKKAIFGFKAAYVFDQSQTAGEELPAFSRMQGDPSDNLTKLAAFIAESGITLEYTDAIAPARGMSSGGKIQILPTLEPAQMFSTLTHELAHELLHKGDRRAETTKTIRETEAEAVAFVVCEAIGLDTNTAAADYISLYRGDGATLAESLHHIQKTASTIIAALVAA